MKMHQRLSWAAAALLMCGQALGQSYTVGPPVSQPYTPLTGATNVSLTLSSYPDTDEGAATIPLGFSFPYYGSTYTSVIVHADGMVLFPPQTTCDGSSFDSDCYTNGSFPSSARAFHNFIAGWWEDLDGSNSTSLVRYSKPTASEIVIEWADWNYFSFSSSASFSLQIKLNASGLIQIHYGTHTGTGGAASAGFENSTGTQGANLLTCNPNCSNTNWPTNMLYTIGQPVQPDLVVEDVVLSGMTEGPSNLSFSIAPSFRNYGQNPANGFLWRAYLSTDRIKDASDPTIFTATATVSVPGGQTASATGSANISPKPGPGQYYVLVEADHTGVVAEASEANNVGSTLNYFTQGVDLVALSVSGPALSGPGNSMPVNVKYFNQGTTPAGSVELKVYLSANKTRDTGDFVLHTGTKTVGGGQTVDEVISIPVPSNVPGGDFYFLLEVDSAQAVAEASETNNLVASTAMVKMEQADLVAESVELQDPSTLMPTAVGYFGQPARLSVRIQNAGGADAKTFRVGVAISTDSNLSLLSDTIVHDEPVALIPAGTTRTVAFTFTVPIKDKTGKDFSTGSYYLFALVDSYSEVGELNESNNNMAVQGAVTMRAPAQDYAVRQLDAPLSAAVGELATVFRAIKNVGNVAGSAVSYRMYASANAIITSDDIPLGIVGAGGTVSESGSVTLGVGVEDRATETVKLPPTMPPGVYYLGCIIDVENSAAELDEANNALASATTVQVAPPALRVTTLQLPDGVEGRPYSFRLAAAGEQGPSSWSLDPLGGALPGGITLATDGTLGGSPTSAAVSAFTVLVTSGGRIAAARLVLRILPPTAQLEVTSTSLPPIINSPGLPYQGSVAAAGGVKPYSWRVAAGALPGGITLAADGVLSGTVRPGTQVGESKVTFEVSDSLGTLARSELKVRVVEPGALIIRTLVIPNALVGSEYLTDLSAQNADGKPVAKPLSWAVVSGRLPDGLSLSTQDDERGILAGKPLVAGTFPMSLQVEDAKGRADVADFILRVFPVRFKLSAVEPPAVVHPGDRVEFTITAAGANAGTVRFSLHSGSLPPGLALSEQGTISGAVSMENAVGVHNFVVEARDGTGASGLGAFTLEVVESPRKVGCSSTGNAPWALLGLFSPLLLIRRRAVSLLAAMLVLAIPITAGAQGQPSYQIVGPNSATYSPLATGTSLSQITTYSGQAITIGFDFKFYGQTFTTVTVSQHGYIAFAGDAGESYNYGIPHSYSGSYYPQTFIAAWWDSLNKTTGSVIQYRTAGTAPKRVTTIEWKDVISSYTTTKFSFQIHLYESTNQIRFAYGTTAPASATASVGIQNAPSDGMAALPCTTSTSGTCGPTAFPSNQAIDFFLPADLVVGSITGDQTGYAGVAFRSTAILKNNGGREAQGAKVRFHLSTDTLWDTGDPAIGESSPVNLSTGQEALVTANAPIPTGTAPGNYFLLALADPDKTIPEQDEGNNVSAPIILRVGPPTPDLVVSGVSSPTGATPGQALSIPRVITNIGNAAATAAFSYTYFISDNSVVTISDVPVSTASIASLGAGASDTRTDSITVPTNLPAGKYWVGACVDYDPAATPTSKVTEISEVNNCATAPSGFILNTGALAVITKTLPTATQYSPYGLRLQATGGDGTYGWSQSGGQLPAGITLSSAGDLVGTPSTTGSFGFTVQVSSGGATASETLSLQVTPSNLPLAIVDQELPTAEFARSYSAQLVAVGGKPPYVWKLAAGSKLPAGLALSTDGQVEGRASEAGEFPFSVELSDAAGGRATKDLRVRVVTPASLHIATSKLATGYLRREYLQALVAVGGRAPYDWSVVKFQQLAESPTEQPGKAETALPPNFGIKIEEDAQGQDMLRGLPAKAGLYALTLRVQDAAGNEDITTLPLLISYDDAMAITTLMLPDAFVGHPYSARLSHNGGAQAVDVQFSLPCVKQVAQDLENFGCAQTELTQTLPPGLFLGADGVLSGTAAPPNVPNAVDANGDLQPVVYSFLVKVTDASGRQDVRGLSIKVRPDYDKVKEGGCAGAGMAPSLFALLAVAGWMRRRR
ncbi:MAG: putative Ig domain-containing protein [Myxococcales bacterium]|nr:putative Ig domain-containing protein [Myxococcales bacterium]